MPQLVTHLFNNGKYEEVSRYDLERIRNAGGIPEGDGTDWGITGLSLHHPEFKAVSVTAVKKRFDGIHIYLSRD